MSNPNRLFPLVVTPRIAETRAYYVDKLGCDVSIDMPGYLQVRFGGENAPELAFMAPDPDNKLGASLAEFPGKGIVVSIPAEDADAHHRRLSKQGADVLCEPSNRPWGWRSFLARDPNGVMLDFFHVLPQARAADATG